MDDLVRRLREAAEEIGDDDFAEAATRIEELTRQRNDQIKIKLQWAARAEALEAEVARITAIANLALNEWALWVHDQLDGTSSLAEAIAEVDAARAALAEIGSDK
jgi:hypothetical protein